MSLLYCDRPRRFSRPTSARTFPETYYNERHAPLDYTRADPYAYPMGGPVSSLRAQSHMDREEFQVEQPGARRRIAVACARCRKRKIRCSGDKGDSHRCTSCKQAGVDASQCQFHRVGSDHVHTVMDNLSMAQSLTSMASAQDYMPLYSAGGTVPDLRHMSNQQYHQSEAKSRYPQLLDTKAAYNPDWTLPYAEDTSPVESYPFSQSSAYLSTPTTAVGSTLDGHSYRWAHPAARNLQPTASYYSDYGNSYVNNGLPYLDTDISPSAAAEPLSPLNMSSLQLTLPERPRQRQLQPTELSQTPRRRLPAPQPHPSHGLHHALDQQQGRRLRSSQTTATPSFVHATSFTKPLLPWTAANENLLNAMNETTTAAMAAPTTTLGPVDVINNASSLLSATTSVDETDLKGPTPSTEFNFNPSTLLDPSATTAPTPPAYSNFRESRDLSGSSKAPLNRSNSSSSLYTHAGRRPSFSGVSSSSSLVSGHQYTPLSQPADTRPVEKTTHDSFERRASTTHLTSSF